jgi:hypothetical protein
MTVMTVIDAIRNSSIEYALSRSRDNVRDFLHLQSNRSPFYRAKKTSVAKATNYVTCISVLLNGEK